MNFYFRKIIMKMIIKKIKHIKILIIYIYKIILKLFELFYNIIYKILLYLYFV